MHILFLSLHYVMSVLNVKCYNCALTLGQCTIIALHIFWLRYVNMNNALNGLHSRHIMLIMWYLNQKADKYN